jgi:hypothetical protein
MYAASGWKNIGRPDFKLVAVEGDESIGNSLAVRGYYNYTNSGAVSTSMKIGQQNIIYDDNRYHSNKWFTSDDFYERFGDTKQKRQFMRGKYPFGLFVDETNMLGYANSKQVDGQWELEVAALNKETKEEANAKLDLPEHKGTAYWNTNAIRGAGTSSISVYMTRYEDFQLGDEKNVNRISRLVRLDIDLKKQSITKVTDMTADLPGYEPNTFHNSDIVFFNNKYSIIQDDVQSDNAESKPIRNYYLYNFANHSMRSLVLNEIAMKTVSDSMNIVGTRLERFTVSDGVVHYHIYEISKDGDPIVNSWKVDTHAWGAIEANVHRYNEHTAQILYRLDKENSCIRGTALVDIETGEVIYRGEVQTDGTEEEQQYKLRRLTLGF